MKRVGVLSLLSIAIVMGLVACKKQNQNNRYNEAISWHKLNSFAEYTDPYVAEHWPKEDEAWTPSCWVYVEMLYPEVKDKQFSALRDSLVKVLTQRITLAPLASYHQDSTQAFMDRYVEAQVADYKEDLEQASNLKFDVFSYSVFSRRIDLCDSLVYDQNGIVSITMLSQEYSGGAHSNDLVTTLNYDLEQNEIITPSVLFTDPTDQRIVDLLLEKLMTLFNAQTPEELEYYGIFSYQALEVTNNFFFTDEGITFYYNPYELAAYAVGAIELTISYGELAPFINEPYTKLLA